MVDSDDEALLPSPITLQDILAEATTPPARGVQNRNYHPLELAVEDGEGRFEALPHTSAGEGGWTVLGASLLFAGSAVGGGMLAVPAATLASGFVPAVMAMGVAWLYLVAHGLILVEVNLAVAGHLKRRADAASVSFLSLGTLTVGKGFAFAVVSAYVLFSTAVLVGQMSRGGSILNELAPSVPYRLGVVLTAGTGAGAVHVAGHWRGGVDCLNRALTLGIFACFVTLLAYALPMAEWSRLERATFSWELATGAMPTLIQVLSFGNLIPVVCTGLDLDRGRVRRAVVLGSLLPLLLIGVWVAMSTALVPFDPAHPRADPIDSLVLQRGGGAAAVVGGLVVAFAGCAVYTTIIGFLIALQEFWMEVFRAGGSAARRVEPGGALRGGRGGRISPSGSRTGTGTGPRRAAARAAAAWAVAEGAAAQGAAARAAAVLPPLVICLLSPGDGGVFYRAINFSGAYLVTFLFGAAPVVMALATRRAAGGALGAWRGSPSAPTLPGGVTMLAALGGATALIVGLSLGKDIPVLLESLGITGGNTTYDG